MLNVVYSSKAIDNLKSKHRDKVFLKRALVLITDACEHPFYGLGKPELLRGNYKGHWSRRIDKTNRLIYRVEEPNLLVISIVGHYPNQ